MKIGQVRAELFYTDRRRGRQTDRQTEIRIPLFTVFRKRLTRHKDICRLNKSRAALLLAKMKHTKAVFSVVFIPFWPVFDNMRSISDLLPHDAACTPCGMFAPFIHTRSLISVFSFRLTVFRTFDCHWLSAKWLALRGCFLIEVIGISIFNGTLN